MCFFLQALFLRVESSVCDSGWSIGAGDYKGAMLILYALPCKYEQGGEKIDSYPTIILFFVSAGHIS